MNMKFWNAGSGRPEDLIHVVKNAESVTINAGQPVIYAMNGTDDGLAVVLPASSSAAKLVNFLAGVTVHNIEPGKLENIQVYGFNRKTLVVRGTRANSTAGWPTMAAISIGEALTIDSVNNGFVQAGIGTLGTDRPFAVVAEQITAGPTLASSSNGLNPASALVYYQAVKAFLRFM